MNLINLYSSVGEEYFGISTDYAAFVGANSFAHNSLNVRINSHLQTKLSDPRQSRGFISVSPSKGQEHEAPEGAHLTLQA